MSKKLKSTIFILFIIQILVFAFLWYRDYNNSPFENKTRDYDGLSFISTFLNAISTLTLGYVALVSNENIAKENKKTIINDTKINGFSKIKFVEKQYLYNFQDSYGFIVSTSKNDYDNIIDKNNNNDIRLENQFRLLLNIKDLANKPLKDFYIKKISIEFGNNNSFDNNKKYNMEPISSDYFELETALGSDDYYLATICFIANADVIKKLKKASYLRLKFTLLVRNCFNVVAESVNEIIIKNNKTKDIYNTTLYLLTFSKIYYKDLTFKDK